MKKLFITFLCLLLTSVCSMAEDVIVDNIKYSLNTDDHTASVISNNYTGDIVIPASVTYNSTIYSVTNIGSYAFAGCTGLTSIEIPNSVTSVDDYAFQGCSGLTSVTIPNSVTSIGWSAFENCISLTSVTIPNSVTSIRTYAFSNTAWYNSQPDGLVYAGKVAYIYKGTMPANTAIVLNDGTTGIAGSAFYNCTNLTGITIPNSVTSIGELAFNGCSSLLSIDIPNSVISIGSNGFGNCTGLDTFVFPKYLEYISNNVLENCHVTSIILPISVTNIGQGAFVTCQQLRDVYCFTDIVPQIHYLAFYNLNTSDVTLHVMPDLVNSFKNASTWNTLGNIVALTEDEIASFNTPTTTSASISAAGIATYCSEYALDFSNVEGLKAYIVSGFAPSTGTLVLTPVTEVPAGEGLLLKGAQGAYDIPTTTTDMYYMNMLTGVTTATNINPTSGTETNFILANGKYGINFYTLSENGELAAGKAYLHLPTSVLSALSKERGFTLSFEDEQTTDISCMEEDAKDTKVFYDLQGRRVDNPRNGLYIVNGKKVFIK